MGKRGRKKKNKQRRQEGAGVAEKQTTTTRQMDVAWSYIEHYFGKLWDNKSLKDWEWIDFSNCLDIAKDGMKAEAIQEFVRLKVIHRAKRRADGDIINKRAAS